MACAWHESLLIMKWALSGSRGRGRRGRGQLTLSRKVCGDKKGFEFLTDSPGCTSRSGHPRLPHSHHSSSTGHTGPPSPSASARLKAAKSHMWIRRRNNYHEKISMCAGLRMDGIPLCLGERWFLLIVDYLMSVLGRSEVRKIRWMGLLLWFSSHGQPLITETEATYSHGERSWDKGSCCRWGQRSWGGAPPHWLAAWASTGWPRSCSPRRWAVNQTPWQRSEGHVPVSLNC